MLGGLCQLFLDSDDGFLLLPDDRRLMCDGFLLLRDDGLLIGYVETPDFQAALDGMAKKEVNARWQAEMAPFFRISSPGLVRGSCSARAIRGEPSGSSMG